MHRPAIFRDEKTWRLAAFGVLAGAFAASLFLPGGGDLFEYYRPFARGCLPCGYAPYYARWFLWPLLLPQSFVWPVWVLVSGAGFLFIARWTKVNPFLLLITLPMLAQWWGGQIDVIVAAGLLLALKGRSPFLRGLGMVMATVKPQLSFLPLLFLLFREKPKDLWKVLLPPLAAGVLSLLAYGPAWPLDWLRNALTLPVHPRRQAGMDLWPLGLCLVWVPFLFREAGRRFAASLVIGSIATPFFSIYSYVIFLAFHLPGWAAPVSYAHLLFLPWFGVDANRFAWILPVSLLFGLLLAELRERRGQRQAARREK